MTDGDIVIGHTGRGSRGSRFISSDHCQLQATLFVVAGLGYAVHAGNGHGVRRVHTERQSATFHGRHSRVLRTAEGRTEGLQDPLGGKSPAKPAHVLESGKVDLSDGLAVCCLFMYSSWKHFVDITDEKRNTVS